MKLATLALVLFSFLFASCAQSPTASSSPETKKEFVTLQIFGNSHQDNPWSWSASAVVFHEDTLTTYLKQTYDAAAWIIGDFPKGSLVQIQGNLTSALPDSAWVITGTDTTRLHYGDNVGGLIFRVK